MQFTRDPIIQCVVIARESHKLLVRSSKAAHQQEYYLDAVEILLIGETTFYRSTEKHVFLLPAADYEIFETRESRISLRLPESRKADAAKESDGSAKDESDKSEKKRERRRSRRGKKPAQEAAPKTVEEAPPKETPQESAPETPSALHNPEEKKQIIEEMSQLLTSLIPPPKALIADHYQVEDTPSALPYEEIADDKQQPDKGA